jgi:hypothetical protein
MLRKLLIIGSIAALFVLSAAPAFGIALKGPDGTVRTVLDIGTDPNSNPAHGPYCSLIVCDGGVVDENPGLTPGGLIATRDGGTGDVVPVNVGAWNAVFGPGGATNTNTPICGVLASGPIAPDAGIYSCDD